MDAHYDECYWPTWAPEEKMEAASAKLWLALAVLPAIGVIIGASRLLD